MHFKFSLFLAILTILLVARGSDCLAQSPLAAGIAIEHFLANADADGDGLATPGDRMTLQWWLDEGGSLTSAMTEAPWNGATYELWSYFETLVVADVPQVADPASGGYAAASAPGPCSAFDVTAEVPTPPFDATATAGGVDLQAAINLGFGSADRWVVEVSGGVDYDPIIIDVQQFPQGITIFADASPAGPAATRVVINGGPNTPAIRICNGCLGFPNPPGAGGSVVIGVAPGTDPLQWQGFVLRDGQDAAGLSGAGIAIDNMPAAVTSVEVRGNIIGDSAFPNISSTNGGGVGVTGCVAPVVFSLNEIRDNVAGAGAGAGAYLGAGVHLVGNQSVTLLNNSIHDNVFAVAALSSGFVQTPRRGGGVFAGLTDFNLAEEVYLCENEIYENSAIEGAGVYVGFLPSLAAGMKDIFIHDCEIRDNAAWVSVPFETVAMPYRGIGACLIQNPGTPSCCLSVTVTNNDFSGNSTMPPAGTDPAGPGGGLYLDVSFGLGVTAGDVAIVGNMFRDNLAGDVGGGGSYLDITSSGTALADISNNTWVGNEVVAGDGAGVYFAAAAAIDSTSNVVHANVAPVSLDPEWFAVSVSSSAAEFDHSIMPEQLGGTSVNLFGSDTVEADPLLSGIGRIDSNSSLCVDLAEPSFVPIVTNDVDLEPRLVDVLNVGAVLDRGADEYFSLQFQRGDTNGDQNLDIADSITLLNSLFGMPPIPLTCLDAGDTNDDGSVNVADAVYFLNWWSGTGPPLLPPFGSCGFDPTVDSLLECRDANYNGCP